MTNVLHLTLPPAAVRYLRTPKGILLLVLGGLFAAATLGLGPARTVPITAAALIGATGAELLLTSIIRHERAFPSGALLTGLIVAMVLSPDTSPLVASAVAALAVGSKYVFRTRWSNVFNPAALGVVVAYFAFGTGQSWWGALPDLPTVAIVLVLASGLFIADRVNKLPMALVFLGAFFALATVTVFGSDPAKVQELFRVPDVNAALFFATFMLDDPPTSPVRYGDQVIFALVAAVASYAVFALLGGVYYLPAGVLVANVWETVRRYEERSTGRPPVARQATARGRSTTGVDSVANAT